MRDQTKLPADISEAQEVTARVKALSLELATQIMSGFIALVFRTSEKQKFRARCQTTARAKSPEFYDAPL
jgi:hypothetical protein